MIQTPHTQSDTRQASPPVQEDELVARIERATQELLTVMDMPGNVVCRDRRRDESACLWVEILSPESRLLIGEHGSTLRAFEHVLRLVLRTVVDEHTRVVADVNAYRARRADFLRRRARDAAQRARGTRRAVVLEPMTAADRRLVHVALSAEADVVTESVGDDPDRRVVVRPKDPLA